MSEPTNLDLTTQQLADRVAAAVARFTGLATLRLSQSPTAPVPDDELAAYDELRAALHDMATTEYDRGYRKAAAGRRIAPDGAHRSGLMKDYGGRYEPPSSGEGAEG